MQTFLPYADFVKSAQALDNRRLGKQRVETLQILHVLRGISPYWQHHTAVRMWRGYEGALAVYGIHVCRAWKARGFQDTCEEKIRALIPGNGTVKAFPFPPWNGNEAFHASHRSNLLRKDEPFYRAHGWIERTDLPYVWPVPATEAK